MYKKQEFYSLVTDYGKAVITNASVLGKKVEFSKIIFGDGNGKYYEPTEKQTKLVNKVGEIPIGQIYVPEENSNQILIEGVLPIDIGGFTIREVGIVDTNNKLLVIAKYPETYKPTTQSGANKDLIIQVVAAISNAESIVLITDPSIIFVTKQEFEEKLKNIANSPEMKDAIKNININIDNKVDKINEYINSQFIYFDQNKWWKAKFKTIDGDPVITRTELIDYVPKEVK